VSLGRSPWLKRNRSLTHLAWARCSRGIRHPWCGLLTVFSHALRGLVVIAVSITPGVVSSRSSHTPCLGSLFLLGVVVAVPVHGSREVGLWREIICDFDRLHFTLQVICTPPHCTTPVGLPSFPVTAEKQNNTKEDSTKKKTKQNKTTQTANV